MAAAGEKKKKNPQNSNSPGAAAVLLAGGLFVGRGLRCWKRRWARMQANISWLGDVSTLEEGKQRSRSSAEKKHRTRRRACLEPAPSYNCPRKSPPRS